MMTTISKGMRVQARWFDVNPKPASIAGEKTKVLAIGHEVTGVVTKIMGNDPDKPKTVRVWIRPDGGGDEVVIKPAWIIKVLP